MSWASWEQLLRCTDAAAPAGALVTHYWLPALRCQAQRPGNGMHASACMHLADSSAMLLPQEPVVVSTAFWCGVAVLMSGLVLYNWRAWLDMARAKKA
jgi:hypothetical protein